MKAAEAEGEVMDCDFCGTWHSSMSCFHPGRQKYDDALAVIKRLREFTARVQEICAGHIEGRSSIDTKACGDCPVWTLRSEANALLKDLPQAHENQDGP